MSAKQENSEILIHGVGNGAFINTLKERGVKEAFVMEGRPHLDGAKVLCKQLLKGKIVPTLISDNMAGFLFYKNFVKEVWIAYQSTETNGAFCDVGALLLGVLAKRHDIQLNIFPAVIRRQEKGKDKDLTFFDGQRVAAKGVKTYVPLVEWLPRKYINNTL